MRSFKKKGSITQEFFSEALQLLIPFIGFMIVLGIILSIGSNRSSQLLFESTEIANIITTASTFNGDLRVKYLTKIEEKNDFFFHISPTQVNTSIHDSELKALSRQIYLPHDFTLVNKIDHPKTQQIQVYKQDKNIGIKDWSADALSLSLFKIGEKTCDSLTLVGKVYLDARSNSDLSALFSQQGIRMTSNRDEASLVIKVSAKESRVKDEPSVVIFPDSQSTSGIVACHIASQFGTLTFDTAKLYATVVPVELNPYVSESCVNSICKPTIVMVIATDSATSGNFLFDSEVVSTIAKKVKVGLAEVSN